MTSSLLSFSGFFLWFFSLAISIKGTSLAKLNSIIHRHSGKQMHGTGNRTCPSCLMTRTYTRTGITMEIFVKKYIITFQYGSSWNF